MHVTPRPGTGDIIAIMIPEPKGQDIVALLDQGVAVVMDITVGTRNLQKYVSRTSVVFVSISFIVLMTISLAWLVFYYIQRFRYVNARDRNQVRLFYCRRPLGNGKWIASSIASHSPVHTPTAVSTMQGNNQHVRSG